MANRRMFSNDVVSTSRFLMLPQTTTNLYFQCGMNCDDDGFIEIIKVMRLTSSTEQDMKLLVDNGYIELFEGYIGHITHHLINNDIRSDRYMLSEYLFLKPQLVEECVAKFRSRSLKNGELILQRVASRWEERGVKLPLHTTGTTTGITKDRIGKVSKGKYNNPLTPKRGNSGGGKKQPLTKKEFMTELFNKFPQFKDKDFYSTFVEFENHRNKLKSSMSRYAISRLFSKLDALSQSNVELASNILNQSIDRGWKGVFDYEEPKKSSSLTINPQPVKTFQRIKIEEDQEIFSRQRELIKNLSAQA